MGLCPRAVARQCGCGEEGHCAGVAIAARWAVQDCVRGCPGGGGCTAIKKATAIRVLLPTSRKKRKEGPLGGIRPYNLTLALWGGGGGVWVAIAGSCRIFRAPQRLLG